MKPTTQIFNLKINSRTFVRVLIFRNRDLMRKYSEIVVEGGKYAVNKKENNKFCARAFLNPVKSGFSSTVILCEGMIGAGIVAHEMTHCAVAYLQGNNLMPSRKRTFKATDEKLAYLIDSLCMQFWNKFYLKKR